MARKAIPAASTDTHDAIDGQLVAADAAASAQLSALAAGYAAERDQLNRLIGRFQFGKQITELVGTVTLATLRDIKDNKRYRALRGQTERDPLTGEEFPIDTWEGFCRAFGRSRRSMEEDFLNLDLFGEAAAGALEFAGVARAQIRQLRALPEPDRSVVVDGITAAADDREAIQELVDGVMTRHAETVAKRDKQIESLQERIKDQEAHAQEVDATVRALRSELRGFKRKPTNERAALVLDEVDQLAASFINTAADIREGLNAVFDAYEGDSLDEEIEARLRKVAQLIGEAVNGLEHLINT